MPYQMLITISEAEKKRVMQDMLDDMTAHTKHALMLKLAKDLRGTLTPEELGKFVMDLRAAMTPRAVNACARKSVLPAALNPWPACAVFGSEENL